MVATISTPPEISSEDRALLLRYFHHRENLEALAAELNTPPRPATAPHTPSPDENPPLPASPSPHSHLPTPNSPLTHLDLEIWAASPRIAPHIALYRARQVHLTRQLAIDNLTRLLAEDPDPIERRRAASAILRTLSPARDKSAQPKPRITTDPNNTEDTETDELDDPTDDEPTDSPRIPYTTTPPTNGQLSIADAFAHKPGDIITPTGTPLPSPSHTPDDLFTFIIRALQHPDTPSRAAGVITLFNLAGNIRGRSEAAINRWVMFVMPTITRRITRFDRAEPGPRTIHLDSANQTFTLHRDTAPPTTLHIQLTRAQHGTLANCWLLRHLYPDTS